jgi:hypothetical protein
MSGLDRAIAECAEAGRLFTAEALGRLADDAVEVEHEGREASLDVSDAVLTLLDQMLPEVKAPTGKPCDDECWKRHVRCALERLNDASEDYARPVDW